VEGRGKGVEGGRCQGQRSFRESCPELNLHGDFRIQDLSQDVEHCQSPRQTNHAASKVELEGIPKLDILRQEG